MAKGIKFHSIYYRYFIFILMFGLTSFYAIAFNQVGDKPLEIGFGKYEMHMSPYQFACRGFAILIVISLVLHFTSWKFSLSKSGIYIKKINITVPWEEVDAVAHVWINTVSGGGYPKSLYNRKSLVIYRKEMKPICIYNISLLSIFLIKIIRPQVKSNILIASMASLLNISLNLMALYFGLVKHYDIKSIGMILGFIAIYSLKASLVPFILAAHQNAIHGKVIFHDSIQKRDRTKAIKI
ncbi:MAG: hypothetical protein HXL86_01140 [[Eubacterium] sulci]|nr:hypothetical protein [[Eubacterium] sulci]